MVSAPVEQPYQPALSPADISWRPVAWFGGLLLLCYTPILYRMAVQWATDEDMGHGFFVPVVAGFIAWQRRRTLLSIPRKPNGWGLALVVVAAFQALAASLGAELFTARLAFLIALLGVILYLGGKAWVQELLLPLALMLFMIPIPQIIYARLTLGLQMLASQLGETLIGWMGIPVMRTGNLLELPSQTLNIVDACSGVRSLVSLLFLSQVYAYFAEKRIWARWGLLVATVPIAIAANAVRVATTGVLSEINTKLAQGVYHKLEGYIVFAIALIALLATHRAIGLIAKKMEPSMI